MTDITNAPERIRVEQDADGFWTCREAVSGSQEYVRADLYEAAVSMTATLVTRLSNSLAVFTKHYDTWMERWGDDEQSSTFSRHTFGELRQARELIEEADKLTPALSRPIDPKAEVGAPLRSRVEIAREAGDEAYKRWRGTDASLDGMHYIAFHIVRALYASPSIVAPVGVKPTVEAHNAAFDPANEALGGAFKDGFREGWLFAKSPDFEDREEAEADYSQEVDIAPSECWDAYRSHYFAMLPLAAIPEYSPEIAAPALTPAEKAGVGDGDAVERVARAMAVRGYARMNRINPDHEKIDGTDHFERWYQSDRAPYLEDAQAAIRALSTTKPAQGDGELRTLLGLALETLDVYADPTGYTDNYGDQLPADAEVHEGLAAKEAAAKIRAALSAQGDDAQEASR